MSNYVYDNAAIFLPLKHGLDWISDRAVNDTLFTRFKLYEMAIPRADLMTEQLQLISDLVKTRYNKLYETTQYKYNPIWNVEGRESRTIIRERGNISKTKSSQFPMNSSTARDVLTSNGEGKEDETTLDEFTRSGNIGVTMTQQLIQAERDIQIDLLALYCNEFADYFIIPTWRGAN